jgi:peroxiredoxin Q/BCP
MKFLLMVGACLFAASLFSSSARGELKPGDPAPDFELKGSDGMVYKLSDLKGKKAIVIAWFPKALTRG